MSTFDTLAGAVHAPPGTVALYLDPHQLDDPFGDGTVESAGTWWELRVAVERHRGMEQEGLQGELIHCTIPGLSKVAELPVDLGLLPVTILDARIPTAFRDDITALPRPVARMLAQRGPWEQRLHAVARELTSAPWPPQGVQELGSVSRLLLALAKCSPAFFKTFAVQCPPGVARSILEDETPFTRLQQIWKDDPQSRAVRIAEVDLVALSKAGLVVAPGDAEPTANRPSEGPDVDVSMLPTSSENLDEWRKVAAVWAGARWSVASREMRGNFDISESFWARWELTNTNWVEWLKQNYGQLLTRSPAHPTTVHHVPHYLERSVVSRGEKVLLLVLDGLGLSQWIALKSWLGLETIEEHLLLAGIPTVTSVSRQSIFSGLVPARFANYLDTTRRESVEWRAFWQEQANLEPPRTQYLKTPGADASDWVDPHPQSVATGIAAVAVDEIMHGASANGDAQFYSGLQVWSQSGFLLAALAWCQRTGAQLWITSDHGNLPAVGLRHQIPNMGVMSSKGMRVRSFPNAAILENSGLPGLLWEPPGYPKVGGSLLFAAARTAYQRGGVVVSHGSLSLDEVVVPFARIV